MKQRPEAVCTIALIAVNVAVFFILSLFGDTEDAVFMMRHGAMYGYLVTHDHEFYRLFTCLFLHFGIEHLLNNMVILGALGWHLEQQTGRIRFLLIYFGSGLSGNIVSLIFHGAAQDHTVSAGASGAIFGLMGALLWVVIANHGRLGRLSDAACWLWWRSVFTSDFPAAASTITRISAVCFPGSCWRCSCTEREGGGAGQETRIRPEDIR